MGANEGYRVTTARGYSLFDVASALQKAIRRNEPDVAVYFAIELFQSGYWRYAWKRLLTISAEDVAGCITQEVKALHDSFLVVNERQGEDDMKGRIFLTKAVLLLSQAYKCRDADHAQIYLYDRQVLSDEAVRQYLDRLKPEERVTEIPEYAYDCHTSKGRKAGKTKDEFMRTEARALRPRVKGLFDDLVE